MAKTDDRHRSAPQGRAQIPDDPLAAAIVHGVAEYAVFKLDRHGHVLTWTPEAQRMLHYTREEIVGQHFSVFGGHDRTLPVLPHSDIPSDTQYEGGWRLRKDGSKLWASVALTPVYGDGGQLAGFAVVMRDESARRRAIEQQRANEALQVRADTMEALLNEVVQRLFGVGLSLDALSQNLEGQPALVAQAQHAIHDVDDFIGHIRTTMLWNLDSLEETPEATAPSEGLHILVVDDDDDMRALFVASLTDLGRVDAVGDAYQALVHIEHNSVDVMILDVLLPGVSGVDLLERVRDLGHDVPVVIVSAVGGGSLDQRALDSGATVVMSKPFDKRLLQASVLEAVRSSSAD